MDRHSFANFDFDPLKNHFLFFERGRPRSDFLVRASLLCFLLWAGAWLVDPAWQPGALRGKGAEFVALVLLIPIGVRVVLIGITVGWMADTAYRVAMRSFDDKPDYAIGVSGIADLDPHAPRVILWPDLIAICRNKTRQTLLSRSLLINIEFAALRPRPAWLPLALWHVIPAYFTERRISIAPNSVGTDDNGIVRLIERYHGRATIFEKTF